MPKERFHILLAEETFRLFAELGFCDSCTAEDYLLAAILPDVFFYDVPSFKLGGYGGSLHQFEGPAVVDFFLEWLKEDRNHLDKAHKRWMLGFASHLLADGFMHPTINRYCSSFSKNLGLTAKSCHHWLESELESYWLTVIGPVHGFLPLLNASEKNTGKITNILDFLKGFLSRAGLRPIPSLTELHNCFAWQIRLLQVFANPKWARFRPLLIKLRLTQSFGVLLAPQKLPCKISRGGSEQDNRTTPNDCTVQFPIEQIPTGERKMRCAGEASLQKKVDGMFRPEFMARIISHLSSHLLELARLI